ncbi:hypothetical protein XENOCAPTIV_002992 [Xenoophorus captivus]|uniref:Uncharacterized protein n=1 Tax=Xenoophorus captivus TaxID=1517983 RepID=A0ABV0QQF0_9TELE
MSYGLYAYSMKQCAQSTNRDVSLTPRQAALSFLLLGLWSDPDVSLQSLRLAVIKDVVSEIQHEQGIRQLTKTCPRTRR